MLHAPDRPWDEEPGGTSHLVWCRTPRQPRTYFQAFVSGIAGPGVHESRTLTVVYGTVVLPGLGRARPS